MANFIVTFRLKSGASYDERYQSVTSKLAELVGVAKLWEETSSFFAFAHTGSIEDVQQALYFESEFDPTEDTMVIIDITNRKKVALGVIEYPNTLTSSLGF